MLKLKPDLKKKKRFAVVVGESALQSKAVRASIIAFLIWSLLTTGQVWHRDLSRFPKKMFISNS